MKRRPVSLVVTDHAVLRYLEREHGIDVELVRRHLAAPAQTAAELGAVAVQVERVKLVVRVMATGDAAVVTVLPRTAIVGRQGDET